MSSVYKEIKPEWEFYEENSLVMREIIEAVALILSSRISKKEKEKMMKKIEKLAKKVSEKYKKYIIISSPTFYEKIKNFKKSKKGFSKNFSKFFIIAQLIDEPREYDNLFVAFKKILRVKRKGRLDQHLRELINNGLIVVKEKFGGNINRWKFSLPSQSLEYFKETFDKLVYNETSLKEFEELIESRLKLEEWYEEFCKYKEEKSLKIRTSKNKRKLNKDLYIFHVKRMAIALILRILKKLYDIGMIENLKNFKLEDYGLEQKDFNVIEGYFLETKNLYKDVSILLPKGLRLKYENMVELAEQVERFLKLFISRSMAEYLLLFYPLSSKINNILYNFFKDNYLLLRILSLYNEYLFKLLALTL